MKRKVTQLSDILKSTVHVCPAAFDPWAETFRLRFLPVSELALTTVNSCQAKFATPDPNTDRNVTVWLVRLG